MNKFLKLEEWGADIDTALIRFAGDEKLYLECVEIFISDEAFMKLKDAMKRKSFSDAFIQAHTLKGVAGNLGLNPLFNSISELVEKLRYEDYENINQFYSNVMKYYQEFIEIVK